MQSVVILFQFNASTFRWSAMQAHSNKFHPVIISFRHRLFRLSWDSFNEIRVLSVVPSIYIRLRFCPNLHLIETDKKSVSRFFIVLNGWIQSFFFHNQMNRWTNFNEKQPCIIASCDEGEKRDKGIRHFVSSKKKYWFVKFIDFSAIK